MINSIINWFKIRHFAYKCLKSGEFDSLKLELIKKSLIDGHSLEDVKIWANNIFSYEQMMLISWIQHLTLDKLIIRLAANPHIDGYKLRHIKYGIVQKLTALQIALFAKLCFSDSQMRAIRGSLMSGLSLLEVRIIADKDFSYEQMINIRVILNLNKDPLEVKSKIALMILGS